MKRFNLFLISVIFAVSTVFISCRRDVKVDFGTVTFGVNMNSAARQITSNTSAAFDSFTYTLSGVYNDGKGKTKISDVACAVIYDATDFEYKLVSSEENPVPVVIEDIRTGSWTFTLSAYNGEQCAFLGVETVEVGLSGTKVVFEMKINNVLDPEDMPGQFEYWVYYPAEQNVDATSFSYELVDAEGNEVTLTPVGEASSVITGPTLYDTYYAVTIIGKIPYGEYTIKFEITTNHKNDSEKKKTLLKKETAFVMQPYGNVYGSFDGKDMDLNNSFTLTVPTEANNILEAMGCAKITKDWYSVFESIALPVFNKDGKKLSVWYYSFDDDEEGNTISIEDNIFNKDHNIKGNVTLSFDYTITNGVNVYFEDYETPAKEQIVWSRTNNIDTETLNSVLNGQTFYLDDLSTIYIGLKDYSSFNNEYYTISVSDNGNPLTGTFNSSGFQFNLSSGNHFINIIITNTATNTEVLTAEASFKVYSNRNDFVTIENVIITGSESWSPYSSKFMTNRELSMPTILMSDHEVTKHEYESLIGNDPSGAGTSGYAPNNPVNNVSWFEALVYCNRRTLIENEGKAESEKLTPAYYFMIDDEKVTDPDTWIATYGAAPNSEDRTGADNWRKIQFDYTANGYRLPVEAEWEWAARAGESYTYSGSNSIEEVAWFKGNSNDAGTHEVKLLKPNKYGLYDMSGNVREWCWDGNSSSIDSSTPLTGTQDPAKLVNRVHRGGSWDKDASYCSINYSYYDYDHLSSFGNIGFRVVRNKYKYELKSDGEKHWYEAVDTEDGDTFMVEKHRWEIEVVEPTSESNGQLTYTCPFCGKVKTESIKYVDPNAFVRVNGIEITGTETWTPYSSVFISGRAITLPTFEICDHEVTRGEYESVMGTDPSVAKSSGYTPYNPVNWVSWYDALVYCNRRTLRENEGKSEEEKLIPAYYYEFEDDNGKAVREYDPDVWIEKLGEQNGEYSPWHNVKFDYTANGYRLPVEAEWEYAARGGESYNYAGSNEITEIAWYKDNSGSITHQVCSLKSNGYGLYDMTGNVSEWCWDNNPSSTSIETNTPVTGSEPSSGINYWYHRQRGGSYVSYANFCTVNYISSEFAHGKQLTQGFRVVRTISPVINTDTFNWYENPIDVSTGAAATSSSTDIYFGVFPKTVLPTDSAITIDESKTKAVGTNTYYKGSDNNWYAKVDENAYGASYKYSDGSTVNQKTASSSRYFKVEPIKWKVLTTNYNNSEKALLVAENVLIGNIPFYADSTTRTIDETTIYVNNYKYSTIRAYLNGKYETEDTQGDEYTGKGFLQTAFTNTAQSYIEDTLVDNSTESACYDDTTLKINSCDNTLDKIFLLSTSEVVNGDYGFDAYAATSDASKNTSRQRVSTDYAKANNVIESSNGGTWWLRSPFGTASTASTDAVRTVSYQGAANGNGPANTMYYGIVPALTISLP